MFAIGNLVHPVVTADLAALDGRHVAAQVRTWLGGSTLHSKGVRLRVEAPLRWVSPGVLRPGDQGPARLRLVLWTDELERAPRVRVVQGGDCIAAVRLPWVASPGRAFQVPSRVLSGVDLYGPDVVISLRST